MIGWPSLLVFLSLIDAVPTELSNWPQWRGPHGTGAAGHAQPPLTWSETENVRWKVPLPGRGHSTPVVWGDQIFVTAAEPFGPQMPPRMSGAPGAHDNLPVTQQHRFVLLCLRRRDGTTLWRRDLHEALPHEGGHQTASLASASPVTDGKHIIAFFGSHGLYCLDMQGELIWSKQLGQMHSKRGHGEGASPALFRQILIVNWDHEGQSFVVALNKSTGKELWRVQRDEVTSWATPIVVEHEGQPQAIVCGTDRVRAYDLQSGKVVWECGGLSANIVATPVASDGLVLPAAATKSEPCWRFGWRARRAILQVPSTLFGDAFAERPTYLRRCCMTAASIS